MNADTDDTDLEGLPESYVQFMDTEGRTTEDVARDLVASDLMDRAGDVYTRTGEMAASLQNDDVGDPPRRELEHLVYQLEELLARVEDVKAIAAESPRDE